jgi:tetratricopeptide (TPR) repeat protein
MKTYHAYIPSFEAYKEFEIGRELFGSDYIKARSHFYKSVKIDSAFTLPLLWLAFTYHNIDQYAKTDSLLDLINKHREDLSLFDRILLDWSIAENSGQKPKAMRFIRKAEELAPKNFTIKYIIGFTALDLNHPRLARETFSGVGYARMIEWTRGYWAFNVLASALYILGEYNDALAVIQLSRKHYPDKSSNLRYESILQAALGQIQEVDRIIDESFQLSGSVPGRVMCDAAKGLRAHGYKDDARKVLQRALKWYTSRTGGDFRYSIARVLYWNEQWAEAQQVFKLLNQEFPDDQNFKGYTGVVAARMGEKDGCRCRPNGREGKGKQDF